MSDVKKKPRKISCLPCRNKKARCDEQRPYCSRCIRNHREHLCIYPKPGTFGRPPKKTIIYKSKDLVATTSKETPMPYNNNSQNDKKDTDNDIKQSHGFIFQNQGLILNNLNPPIFSLSNNLNVPQRFIKYNNQILDIEKIYSLYVSRSISLRQRLSTYKAVSPVKLRVPNQLHTWLTSNIVNITIKRTCQLIDINSFYDPELSMNAFMEPDETHAFFFDTQFKSSPLKSIPPDQVIQLIDHFFESYPYHILLNKTKLLHDYWNDAVEPLLLCVILGIATYSCQYNIGSDKLWDTNRNPFLNYAYVLMEKFFIKRDSSISPSTLGNYQAAVILGIFEIINGLQKHGMTIISVSYMMAADLGVFNHNLNITDGVIDSESINNNLGTTAAIHLLDPVDRELLISTYWTALTTTAYGCLELGLYLRDTLLFHGQPFPAANGQSSASYQYDVSNNNHSPSSSYLIESFHTKMVIAYFSSKLFACLPKTEYNLFGCKTYPPPSPTDREKIVLQDHQILLQVLKSTTFTAPSYNPEVDTKIQGVLQDFLDFIMQEKCRWSYQQNYIIETTYYLYYIHSSFIKSSNNVNPIRYQQAVADMDISNPQVSARITNLQPATLVLIYLLQNFLREVEDRYSTNTKKEKFNLEQDNESDSFTALLPYELMSTVLETIVELTIYHYQLGINPQKIFEQINFVYELVNHPIFWTAQQEAVTKLIYKRIKEFIKLNQIQIIDSKNDQQTCTNSYLENELNSMAPIQHLNDNIINASADANNVTNIDITNTIDNLNILPFLVNENQINFNNINTDPVDTSNTISTTSLNFNMNSYYNINTSNATNNNIAFTQNFDELLMYDFNNIF